MEARACRFVFAPLIISVLAAALSAQDRTSTPGAAVPVAPATALTGRWLFNDATREDARNWRRPVAGAPFGAPSPSGATPAAPAAAFGSAYSGRPRPAGSLGEPFDSDVRRALRDLLEVTRRFEINVGSAQVTFTDDLSRVFTYSTDGRREKHRAGGTEYDVRTTWEGPVLHQEISAFREFKMTQAFLLSEDGGQMFVWLTVDKPALVPPVRKLTRVYTRLQ
jgi:hypothetical protein